MTEELIVRLRKIAGTDFEIFPLLKQRYSPHVFRENPIDDDMLHRMFEAGRWAPSRDNNQPWRFVYAQAGTEAHEMILSCLEAGTRKWAGNAPLLMVGACRMNHTGADEQFIAIYDLGLCLGNMTVQAQYMGIGLHQIASLDRRRLRNLFDIPWEYHISTVIAAGYYGGDVENLESEFRQLEMEERKRIPQSEFVCREHWPFCAQDAQG